MKNFSITIDDVTQDQLSKLVEYYRERSGTKSKSQVIRMAIREMYKEHLEEIGAL